jgi:hypothetical protein
MSGANAQPVSPYSGFWLTSLPCDSQAQWIAVDSNRSARSILFAQPFEIPCRPVDGTVTLTFCWAVDDRLGDPSGGPNPAGVYINGVPLPISGGSMGSQSTATVSVPASILNPGVNWLYVYVRDLGCAVSGVIYSATIRGLCWQCRLDNCQAWNDCLPSTQSAVRECAPPSPANLLGALATDDFIARYTGAVNTVEWWGVLSHPAQRWRPFLVAFYRDTGNCRPSQQQPIFFACVKPLFAKPVGVDCQGRRVWHFVARLPSPYFNQVAGQRYWLAIAEVDALSIHPGQPDFFWSGHRACGASVCGCQALSVTTDAAAPVLSQCDGNVMDLAWCLKWRSYAIIGVDIPFNPATGALRYRLKMPQTDIVLQEGTLPIEEIVRDDGTVVGAILETDLPEGTYSLELVLPGALPRHFRFSATGEEVPIRYTPLLGDLNGDGVVDDADLLTVLFNFGAGG